MIFFETGFLFFFWKTVRATIQEMMEILSERQLKKLSEHKYKRDGDYTLLEPYLQPFWTWTVEKCPLWWAPNAITFIGLLINLFTSLLVIIYNPDGRGQSPGWTFILAALGIFIYQTMDSIDGKQARRTNSSSPLGELFDHGCDSVSAVVLTIASLIHCRLAPYQLMFLVCGAYHAFYVAHWVTYCTGTLSFGKMDVVELHFLMIGSFFMTCFMGEDFWLSEVPVIGMTLNWILVLVVTFSGIIQAAQAYHTIFVKGGIGRNGSTVADTSVVFPGFSIATVLALTVVIAKKSELGDNVYDSDPALYLIMFGFVFSKVTCKLIIAQMSKSELQYWDSIYFGPALLFLNQYFDFALPELYVLYAAFIFSLLNLLHYSHAVSSQICKYLGIYCFSIQKRPSSDMTNSKSTNSRVTTRLQSRKSK